VAFLLLWGVYGFSAQPRSDRVVVSSVQVHRPASGVLRPGDVLLAVDGRRVDLNDSTPSFVSAISAHICRGAPQNGCLASTPARLEILRGGRRLTVSITPRYDPSLKRTAVGFKPGEVDQQQSLGQAAGSGISQMWHVTSLTVSRISEIFVSESARKEVHSIVGISAAAKEEFSYSTPAAIYLLAIVSLSLAIINLFPFLPLDGGHIFWALAEKFRGRPIPFAVMERASVVGFALVLVLFMIGFTNDIHTFSHGGFHIH
jgi:regulator of sigma E protease